MKFPSFLLISTTKKRPVMVVFCFLAISIYKTSRKTPLSLQGIGKLAVFIALHFFKCPYFEKQNIYFGSLGCPAGMAYNVIFGYIFGEEFL